MLAIDPLHLASVTGGQAATEAQAKAALDYVNCVGTKINAGHKAIGDLANSDPSDLEVIWRGIADVGKTLQTTTLPACDPTNQF